MLRALVCVFAFLTLSVAALADDGFQVRLHGQATGSIDIGEVSFAPALLAKSDQFGETELPRLAAYLREDLERALVRANWHGMAIEQTHLDVTIVDVRPNRPTMTQLQNMDSVNYRDHTAGGAALAAELRTGDGDLIAEYSYEWFNPEPEDTDSQGTWSDTRTAFGIFAEDIAESLGIAPMPGS